ncbi:MAG: LiaF transmembrane domain-containing protein [Bacteroidales bacterium]
MKHREHPPAISIGLFFIVLGLALLVATNDLLNLGSTSEYFTWQTALMFIGVLLLVNLRLVVGILLIAVGTWFFFDHIFFEVPQIFEIIYWPSVIIVIGLAFIISSFGKRNRRNLTENK